jgi:hypothetical protein
MIRANVRALMDVGKADAACMHLHQHLIGPGLRLGHLFDVPRTAHSGNDRLHNLLLKQLHLGELRDGIRYRMPGSLPIY